MSLYALLFSFLSLTAPIIAQKPAPHRIVPHDSIASITPGPRLLRRDPLPTIVLQNDDTYNDVPQETPVVTGTQVSLVARGEPSLGVDVWLADEVFDSVKRTINEKCKKSSDQDCHKSVAEKLNPSEFELQSRQLGVLALISVW